MVRGVLWALGESAQVGEECREGLVVSATALEKCIGNSMVAKRVVARRNANAVSGHFFFD